LLARHGLRVTGVDIADQALARGQQRAAAAGLQVEWLAADLDEFSFQTSYDLIININFLQRRLLVDGVRALSPGGLILVDTILAAPQAPVPSHSHYLLQPGELLGLFSTMPGRIVHGEERPTDATPTAKIIFQKEQ
jgi:tellurite methyltransferase